MYNFEKIENSSAADKGSTTGPRPGRWRGWKPSKEDYFCKIHSMMLKIGNTEGHIHSAPLVAEIMTVGCRN